MVKHIKKIMFIILSILIILYATYDVFTYAVNNIELNKIVAERNILLSKYNVTNNIISKLQNDIDGSLSKKDNLNLQIKEKEGELNVVSTQLNEKKIQQSISNNVGTKTAYLTFDDGPSGYTPKVLDILKKYNIKATFFVTGKEDKNSISTYKRIVSEGHSIGNHTYNHDYKTVYSSVEAFDNSFSKLQTLIKTHTGVEMSLMRFPGGSNNSAANNYYSGIMDVLTNKYRGLNYKYFDWNVSAGDGAPSGVTKDSVISKITSESQNKTYIIVLMHDSMPTTPEALETVIKNLVNLGFNFYPLTPSSKTIRFK